MKIKTKLQLIIACNILLLIGIVCLGALMQRQADQQSRQEALVKEFNLAVFERARLREEYFLYRTERSKEQFLLIHKQIGGRLEAMAGMFSDPEERAYLDRMTDAQRKIGAFFDRLVGLDDPGGARNAGTQALRERIVSQMLVNAHVMYREGLGLIKAVNEKTTHQQALARLYGMIAFGLLILLSGAFAVLMIRNIIQPLKRLQEGAEIIARGNLDGRTGIRTPDEIGQLSRAFDAMTESLKKITVSRNELNKEIEKRRQKQEALWAVSTRQEFLLSAVPDIIMEVDGYKVYTWANQAGLDFFGDEAIGKEAAFFFEGDQETYAVVQPLFDGMEGVIYLESWQRRRDGEKRLLAWWCRTLKDESGQVTGALSSARDITERYEAEATIRKLNEELERRVIDRTAKLEYANRELEAFSYSVSHDLRGPLRAIDGFSRILLEDCGDKLDAEGRRLLNVIRTNTQQMDLLITGLLTLSRVAKSELKFSRIDMTAMAQAVYHESVPPEVQEKFVFTVAPLPESRGDPVLLRQVWVNLLGNAVKFTLPCKEKRIEIDGRREGDMNVYSIRDTGVGFNPKYLYKIFGVFQRLHSAEQFEGTGVGLAIVQRIIQRHGGHVWAEGNVNAGAVFSFSLPREDATHERQE